MDWGTMEWGRRTGGGTGSGGRMYGYTDKGFISIHISNIAWKKGNRIGRDFRQSERRGSNMWLR
jgi:hypothetical protein